MPHIHQTILIGSTPEKVYKAITGKEVLASWWTPYTESEPGQGCLRFTFGEGYFKVMKILDSVPSASVKWECIIGAEEWIGTTITFELHHGNKEALLLSHPEVKDQLQQQSKSEATLLIFRHDNWKDYTPIFAECSYTWGQFLKSLKMYCETGKGTPWPNQHK